MSDSNYRLPDRGIRKFGLAEYISLAVMLLAAALPMLTHNILMQSLATQIMVGLCGALAVHLMLRLNLMNFAVPGFMAVGGYAAAIATQNGIQELFALLLIAFLVPFLCALPLGWVVLRLKGVYFVLVTYLLTEIVQLIIVETPQLTGGTNGLIGFPPAEFFGTPMITGAAIFYVCYSAAMAALLITLFMVRRYSDVYDSQAYNDTLAQSLGLRTAGYKVQVFSVSAGIAGLGGFALISLLINAHPLSFTAASSVTYIAYVLIGGAASVLGALIGSVGLVVAISQFSWSGEYSLGLFGLLLVCSVLFIRGGITGTVARMYGRYRASTSACSTIPVTRGDTA